MCLFAFSRQKDTNLNNSSQIFARNIARNLKKKKKKKMTREKLNLIFLRFHVKSFHHRLSLGKGNATENLHISDKCSS